MYFDPDEGMIELLALAVAWPLAFAWASSPLLYVVDEDMPRPSAIAGAWDLTLALELPFQSSTLQDVQNCP